MEDEAKHRRRAEGDEDPRHRDAARALHLGGVVDGHEPHEDVRHAEVAEPPGEAAGEADEAARLARRGGGEEVQEVAVDHVELVHRRGEAARVADDDGRHEDDRDEHEKPLHEVRPAHRHVAAEERVAHHHERADPERGRVGDREHRREELRGRDEAGGRVEGEEDEDDERRDDARDARLVAEAVRDEVGDRDRVAADLRIAPQTVRDDLPVQVRADREADADPRLGEAAEEDRAGKAHQQPAAHVARLGGERDDPLVHLAPAEEVVPHVLLPVGEEEADAEHQDKIDDERAEYAPVDGPGNELCKHVMTFLALCC